MKTNRKHGFTIVELVVVIAIIAVLAAVLIPTFASIIKKANDSAYLQERTSKQIEDLAEKVENQNYLTWEDFEAVLARELAKVGSTQTADIEKAIKVALAERAGSDNGLSEAQVQKIINEAMSGQLTTAQVEAIVKAAVGNKTVDVNAIANQVIAKLPKTTGITKEEMQKAINEALSSLNISSITEADIEKALAAFGVSTLTEEQIVAIATQIATEVSEKTGNEKIVATLNIRAAGNEKATLYDTFVAMSISDPTTAVKSITAGETILWDSVEKEFVLYKNDNYTGARYWTVSDVISDKWSTYYTGTESTISTTKGFDAGTTTSVTSVTYTNTGSAQDVVIRTNSASTTLTIDDASEGTISHYGVAGALNIIQCHTASYHENGTVAFAEIAKGRIVLESGSEIKHIHVNAKEDDNGNSLNEFDTIIIADNGAKALPEAITRDQVDVSEAKPVVTVESGSTSETVYVYPYTDAQEAKTGTTEQTETQNTSIVSALGQLVLDNGSDAGEKAMSNNEKEETKNEVVNEAIRQEELINSNHVHEFEYTSNNDGTHTGTCECGETVTENCDYTDWSHDAEGHWHSCSKCGDGQSEGKVAHTWSLGADDTNSSNHCTTCGRFRWTAEIGNVGYETLKAAIAVDKTASSESGYKGTLITMLNDEFITDTQYVTISESQIITLNLNGYVLFQEVGHSNSQTHVISSKGTLTINDTSASKTGMIYSHHMNTEAKWSAGHYAVDCAKGSITINGGTFKQVNDVRDISWALHCGSYGADATTTINGGTFIGDYYDVGLYNNNGGTQKAYINGGTFKGTGTNIYMQFATSNSTPGMLLEINGGEFITSRSNIVYVSGQPGTVGVDASDLRISITGGTFSIGEEYYTTGSVVGFGSYSVSGEDDAYVSGGIFNFNVNAREIMNGKYAVPNTDTATSEEYPFKIGNASWKVSYVQSKYQAVGTLDDIDQEIENGTTLYIDFASLYGDQYSSVLNRYLDITDDTVSAGNWGSNYTGKAIYEKYCKRGAPNYNSSYLRCVCKIVDVTYSFYFADEASANEFIANNSSLTLTKTSLN